MAVRHTGMRSRRPRRSLGWVGSTPQTGLTALAASTSALIEVFVPGQPEQTLLRVRGAFGWRTDQLAASEVQLGAVGIILVEEPAATVGITAIPTPATDSEADWLWHSYYQSRFEFGSAIGFITSSLNSMVIDSKAKRKINSAQRFVMVIENTGTTGIQFAWSTRLLLQTV